MSDYHQSPDPSSVHDRDSFVVFVQTLIADREDAEAKESAHQDRFMCGGANGWHNLLISSYLECALAGLMNRTEWTSMEQPSWRDLANFLYAGKTYI